MSNARKTEQARILAGMKAHGLKGRAVDDLWTCDAPDCDLPDVVSKTDVAPKCPHCGATMLQVLVEGEPIVLS